MASSKKSVTINVVYDEKEQLYIVHVAIKNVTLSHGIRLKQMGKIMPARSLSIVLLLSAVVGKYQ